MTELKIEGMTCGHCVSAVRRALATVAGVEQVEVDLGRGVAKVQGKAEARALIAAVEEEGYAAREA